MTSDEEDEAETNKIIEASGTAVPDTIEEDSSGSATMDIESDWTSLPRHGLQQKKEDSPLSDISESAFKGWASPLIFFFFFFIVTSPRIRHPAWRGPPYRAASMYNEVT